VCSLRYWRYLRFLLRVLQPWAALTLLFPSSSRNGPRSVSHPQTAIPLSATCTTDTALCNRTRTVRLFVQPRRGAVRLRLRQRPLGQVVGAPGAVRRGAKAAAAVRRPRPAECQVRVPQQRDVGGGRQGGGGVGGVQGQEAGVPGDGRRGGGGGGEKQRGPRGGDGSKEGMDFVILGDV
jgi:hypothetical protein